MLHAEQRAHTCEGVCTHEHTLRSPVPLAERHSSPFHWEQCWPPYTGWLRLQCACVHPAKRGAPSLRVCVTDPGSAYWDEGAALQ